MRPDKAVLPIEQSAIDYCVACGVAADDCGTGVAGTVVVRELVLPG